LFLFATRTGSSRRNTPEKFQSQAGFVPLCDTNAGHVLCALRWVSIPGGICSSLRLNLEGSKKVTHTMFQSQAGFVPLCDSFKTHVLLLSENVSIPGGICSSLRPLPPCQYSSRL